MADTGFFRPRGLPYRRFFRRLHRAHIFDWYMEIGCRSGKVFGPVRSKTIAVDPFFKIEGDVIAAKPQLHIFQTTSDAFFESEFLEAHGIELSVTFLDGMHLFEYLLRDFINTERASRPDGAIVMHDCCPYSFEMCTRDLDNIPVGAWTGDVWKLIPILMAYRPDLRIDVLDSQPTGLVVVSNLDPGSNALSDAYDDIVAEWTTRDLETYGLAGFYALFDFADTAGFDAETDVFSRLSLDPEDQPVPEYATP